MRKSLQETYPRITIVMIQKRYGSFQYDHDKHWTLSQNQLSEESVTLAKAGVHFKPFKIWIPVLTGMKKTALQIVRRYFDIGLRRCLNISDSADE